MKHETAAMLARRSTAAKPRRAAPRREPRLQTSEMIQMFRPPLRLLPSTSVHGRDTQCIERRRRHQARLVESLQILEKLQPQASFIVQHPIKRPVVQTETRESHLYSADLDTALLVKAQRGFYGVSGGLCTLCARGNQ
jgi:hypothetical protein